MSLVNYSDNLLTGVISLQPQNSRICFSFCFPQCKMIMSLNIWKPSKCSSFTCRVQCQLLGVACKAACDWVLPLSCFLSTFGIPMAGPLSSKLRELLVTCQALPSFLDLLSLLLLPELPFLFWLCLSFFSISFTNIASSRRKAVISESIIGFARLKNLAIHSRETKLAGEERQGSRARKRYSQFLPWSAMQKVMEGTSKSCMRPWWEEMVELEESQVVPFWMRKLFLLSSKGTVAGNGCRIARSPGLGGSCL